MSQNAYVYLRHKHMQMSFVALLFRKEHTNMTEEELKAKENELTTKEEDLKKREDDLKASEDALKAKEEDLKKREEDVNALVGKMTKEYEGKLAKQKDEYEKRLEEREKVIKQLLNGDGAVDNTPSAIEELNARRQKQRRG